MTEKKWNEWIRNNIEEVLRTTGMKEGYKVLDFGSGHGAYTIPVSKMVGSSGRVYSLDKDKNALLKVEEKAKREGMSNIKIVHTI